MIREIFEGIINPDWHERIDKQLDDDAGGYGEQNSIAIFGEPGSEQVRVRHDRPAHDAPLRRQLGRARRVRRADLLRPRRRRSFDEEADHPGNVFWPQALAANKLYEMLDGKQQKQALLRKGAERVSASPSAAKTASSRALPSRSCRAIRRSTCRRCWRCSSSRTARATATKSPHASRRKAASTPATWRSTPGRHRQRRRVGHLAAGRPGVRLALPRRAARPRVGQRGGRSEREAQCIGRQRSEFGCNCRAPHSWLHGDEAKLLEVRRRERRPL